MAIRVTEHLSMDIHPTSAKKYDIVTIRGKRSDILFSSDKQITSFSKQNSGKKVIRGGTDGAALTWNGVLCPNLGTGGGNFHGVHEYWCKEDGEKMVELVVKLLSLAKKA